MGSRGAISSCIKLPKKQKHYNANLIQKHIKINFFKKNIVLSSSFFKKNACLKT